MEFPIFTPLYSIMWLFMRKILFKIYLLFFFVGIAQPIFEPVSLLLFTNNSE